MGAPSKKHDSVRGQCPQIADSVRKVWKFLNLRLGCRACRQAHVNRAGGTGGRQNPSLELEVPYMLVGINNTVDFVA